ncbi:DNA-processing protein DprA [Shewanella sp. 10N.286.48.A6]|uniref:DNA-processing protein DprA n=1 Tax=Shewanella sp. 10N.286.48.A6 TaxID=1880833 RepID=UPI000C83E472|nr:DNA-processing protein DprA [Shewanella sp. 10N.286.48.A6]PMH99280.1 DNA protecting protein DprA [Shewanella sp. 10N.286.48.A6]
MDVEELRQRLEFEKLSLPLSAKLLSQCQIDFDKVDLAIEWLNLSPQHHIVTLSDPDYPALLQQISDPPGVLFIKGQLEALLRPSIGMVGSRNASVGGLNMAKALATEMVQMGFSITSGMAAGIDGAAHKGAVDSNGVTLAVLGTGVECIYPKRHSNLYHQIQHQGCVLSEFWPQVGPYAGNFPRRNRIISGLSLGTIVVEATRKSGSLISARLAMEQNREVFAVPGSVLGGYNQGCHDLLKNGAKLVECATDVVEELSALTQFHLENVANRHHIADNTTNLPFSALLASVGYEATSLDAVVEHSGKSIDLVLVEMLELELQGQVAQVPGGYVRLERR